MIHVFRFTGYMSGYDLPFPVAGRRRRVFTTRTGPWSVTLAHLVVRGRCGRGFVKRLCIRDLLRDGALEAWIAIRQLDQDCAQFRVG